VQDVIPQRLTSNSIELTIACLWEHCRTLVIVNTERIEVERPYNPGIQV